MIIVRVVLYIALLAALAFSASDAPKSQSTPGTVRPMCCSGDPTPVCPPNHPCHQ